MTTIAMTPIGRGGSKYLLRLPPTLHDRLRKLAKAEGMSINTLIATLLAGAVGYDVVPTLGDDHAAPEAGADTAADVLAQVRALVASPALDAVGAPEAA